ncbi:hypothetical protein L3V82_00585 [Thiotrichales bacterium 19S3-7]|nr:hypothetical protein [Thiotrichales bacterium 19S3-7]MCF6800660.1 hypothetical protein [Thiotrichales bacterium 19S3-11]
MPYYTYRSINNPDKEFEFFRKLDQPPLEKHPLTGEGIRQVITLIHIKQRGLKKGTVVNKSSPAATACGCASKMLGNSHAKKSCC